MPVNVILLILGIILLYKGSEWMVKGAASLALSMLVRPIVVGLTVVAFATSAPELLVSVIAAIKGSAGVSLGNILGSNVANIGLVLGFSALIRPLVVEKTLVRREIPYMIGASGVFWVMCLDGGIGRVDGVILLAGLAFFLIWGIITAKEKNQTGAGHQTAKERKRLFYIFLILIGTAGLVIGANLGGNMTPIGSPSNVITIGISEQEGYPISFTMFLRLGLSLTVLYFIISMVYLYVRYGMLGI